MARPTLDERFYDSYPTRGADEYHAWLNAEEQRFILWGLKEKWSAARIGRALNINEVTVRRFRNRVWDRPKLLLELGLYEKVGSASDDEFRCLVCGERVERRPIAEHHLINHYVDDDIADAVIPSQLREPPQEEYNEEEW